MNCGGHRHTCKNRALNFEHPDITLIERLEITANEQKHMKTIIGTDEKYERNNERRRAERRNEEGLTKKQQELKKLYDKIKRLKNKSISEELSIPLKTLERHITKMKKSDLL